MTARRRSALLCVTIVVLAVGCSAPLVPSEPPRPPTLFANGVAGATITHCIGMMYCADGGPSGTEPMVELPITLTFEQPITHVSAEVTSLVRDWEAVQLIGADADGRPSTQTIRIDRLPPGDWEGLIVSVGMADEVSVAAAWTLPD